MKIYSPTASQRRETVPIASRGKALEGQTWGFVDTSKVNADLFIEELKREVQKHFAPKGFVVIRKEAPGFPLTLRQIEDLAAQCSFVIFCFGD